MSHVVLLGDSIFDNASYVPGRPAVIDQMRTSLPRGWRATLLAVDGAVASDVPRQLSSLPEDATHLVVSVGGNDALKNSGIIEESRLTVAQGFRKLADVQERFRRDYGQMLDAVVARGKPTAVCTIYDSVPGLVREAVTALSIFNDVILGEAFRRGLPVGDLRLICTDARDYSSLSPIEPSEGGGTKIVQLLRQILTTHDFGHGRSAVYGHMA